MLIMCRLSRMARSQSRLGVSEGPMLLIANLDDEAYTLADKVSLLRNIMNTCPHYEKLCADSKLHVFKMFASP